MRHCSVGRTASVIYEMKRVFVLTDKVAKSVRFVLLMAYQINVSKLNYFTHRLGCETVFTVSRILTIIKLSHDETILRRLLVPAVEKVGEDYGGGFTVDEAFGVL